MEQVAQCVIKAVEDESIRGAVGVGKMRKWVGLERRGKEEDEVEEKTVGVV